MPYIEIKTNRPVDAPIAGAVQKRFGRAIERIPGKSEAWLMVNVIGGEYLSFQGTVDDAAIAEIKIFGEASDAALDAMTEAATEILSEELGIPGSRIYIKYEFCRHWGYDGSNF